MNAASFDVKGPLQALSLRALQFGVAYLVNEQELPDYYNGQASAVVTAEDAQALMRNIYADACGSILR